MSLKRFSVEQEDDIIRLYLSEFKSPWAIASIYGTNKVLIAGVLKRRGIQRRTKSEAAFNRFKSKEQREIVSKRFKTYYANAENRKALSNLITEIMAAPEIRQNISTKCKEKWATKEHRDKMIALKQSPEYRSKMKMAAKYRKQAVFTWVSKPEKMFLDLCEKTYKVTIERQVFFDNNYYDGRYKNTIIELDGDYWHKKKGRDMAKDYIARRNGYNVIRLTLNKVSEVPDVFAKAKPILDTAFI